MRLVPSALRLVMLALDVLLAVWGDVVTGDLPGLRTRLVWSC